MLRRICTRNPDRKGSEQWALDFHGVAVDRK